MAKKDDKKNYIIIILIGAVLLLALAVASGKLVLPGAGGANGGGSSGGGIDFNPTNPTVGYEVVLSLSKYSICLGDAVTGYVNSNINNGKCALFANGNFVNLFNLDANGDFQQATTPQNAGTAVLRVVCADAQNNMKASNEVTLVVIDCSNPDGGGGDEDGGGIACTSVWNPSVANCQAATCTDSTKCCFYVPDTSTVPDHCACLLDANHNNIPDSQEVPITTCDEFCTKDVYGFPDYQSGACGSLTTWDGSPIRNPCNVNGGTHVSGGDVFCPVDTGFGSIHKWCCCSMNW